MEAAFLLYNLDFGTYVSSVDADGNIFAKHEASEARTFKTKNEAITFLVTNNGYHNYYTIIEAYIK